MRLIVEEARTRGILSRDLCVAEPPQVVRALSGAATLQFKVFNGDPSAAGIDFKAYGQIIHVEINRQDGTPWVFASCLVTGAEIEGETGDLVVNGIGFSNYPDKMPWLDNWNPIAIDPYHVVHRIWNHLQSYPHGDLDVTITPADSGTLLLPGFYFDGSEFVLDFFAYFVRAADYRDCLEEITSLCRDIPIDFIEVSEWNEDRTQIDKSIELAYPRRGVVRAGLSFRLGENVLQAQVVSEQEIDWVSDIIVRGWWPGKMHSSTLSNADPKRFRRVIKDEDALINSRERAEVWAKRKLTRRTVPKHWTSITLDMYHPSAAWGTYEVGDDILVQGEMPFHGKVAEWHRILTIQPDDTAGQVVMTLKHVNGFNYDAIDFEG